MKSRSMIHDKRTGWPSGDLEHISRDTSRTSIKGRLPWAEGSKQRLIYGSPYTGTQPGSRWPECEKLSRSFIDRHDSIHGDGVLVSRTMEHRAGWLFMENRGTYPYPWKIECFTVPPMNCCKVVVSTFHLLRISVTLIFHNTSIYLPLSCWTQK